MIYFQVLAKIHNGGENLVLLSVNDWEGVDGNKYFVSLAVDSNTVVVILVFVVGRELNINFFSDSCRDHPFLAVPDLEIRSRWGKNVKPLRSWRVVDQADLLGMSLPDLEPCKFDHGRTGSENPI